jgi:hypothetical protein
MKQASRILSLASGFALVAVALMIWSLFDPRPVPVIVAMSIGQVVGTLSLLSFGYVIVADWRTRQAPTKSEPTLPLESEPRKV